MSKLGQPSPKKAIQPNALQCKAACSRANSAQKWQRYIKKLIFSYIYPCTYIYFNKHTSQINTQTHTNIMASKINRNYWKNNRNFVKNKPKAFLKQSMSYCFFLKNQISIADWFCSKINRSIDFFQSWSLWVCKFCREKSSTESNIWGQNWTKNGEHAHKKKATKAAFRNSTKNVGT